MRRKPQRNRNRFNFMVKARDLSSKQTIIEKAEEHEVNMKKGGRPNLRQAFL